MMKENEAQISSLIQVQTSQALAYASLKTNLGLSNGQLLTYIKTKVIKNYQGKDLALSLESPEAGYSTGTN
jgi:hypothetical protein